MVLINYQLDRSPKVVALFSATNFSSYIIELKKKWSTAESRGLPRLLVHRIEAMGETGPESEDPLAVNFLCCAGVAGFGDKRQNVARDLSCVRSVVGKGEMSS